MVSSLFEIGMLLNSKIVPIRIYQLIFSASDTSGTIGGWEAPL